MLDRLAWYWIRVMVEEAHQSQHPVVYSAQREGLPIRRGRMREPRSGLGWWGLQYAEVSHK